MPADHPNIDLHSHTTRSDGTLSPTALVQRARANGVDMLALTDHDVLDGLPEAQAAAPPGVRSTGARHQPARPLRVRMAAPAWRGRIAKQSA